ncbi:mitochondrial carrier [Metschnikowia bicuspidata var. bicuspidata NRRL YB-4993]|uniref:Mitochondrial carrier n=1 Tax=Metschnikowia bicuspidata var. bicuspidata NRRL YB-4993 TaxID=869754 RepID=A0A1A0HIF3_9ASCO|nr:mitochondrial carrier [Metschnikowia bicuspidata var. bicuspidata NRRL YB-4993]OBA23618.1 mitochondrial carrier [Metschnikowia bicuspidata var. bicuspidata NRRL YB-4993]
MVEKTEQKKNLAQEVSLLGGFIAGSIAACGAVTFTNPIELIKTRMQLQGELSLKSDAPRLYKNPLQASLVIYKNEGLRGLQQGLICGYVYQIALNGCRLGLYEPTRYYMTKVLLPDQFSEDASRIPQNLFVNVMSGIVSGWAGAVISNPFFLIKTRMQSFNKAGASGSVGQQTYYRGLFDGLKTIYANEGIKGWFRGTDAALLRTGAGSAAQLPVYNFTKNYILKHDLMTDGSVGLHLVSSSMTGLGVAIVMNPWDVVLTRVYNQKGNLYTGPIDCFIKTIKTEGPTALYKGFWAQLFRIGPHSILMLLFMEQSMKLLHTVEKRFT